jgi:class 3 adenylate cyclase/predicted ATPase
MDLGDWLRSLGLGQYEAAFRENEIDDAVLPSLTAEDLKDLGVNIVGHRRKLLDAIAVLRVGARATTGPPDARPVTDGAERRQLTVMFCDLVGSTALSAQLDPEDMREIIGAYHRTVTETITRFAGYAAKYMGDGVLVYFGYPQAHEDDPERAVRAGLAVIDAVGRLAAPEPLRTRLGIASGLVVVGDLIGSGAAQERGVVGDTPNLAARLQALATPDTLVICGSTRQQIGGLFEMEDLGLRQLAGFAQPQRAWRVLTESAVLSRFEALRTASLTPFVGREEEIELLLRRWRRAASGEGQVVLICGEPGIGKSRLTAALRDRIEGEDLTRLRYFCSPHHQDSAFYPFISQLQHAAGFKREDLTEMKLDKLESLLAPALAPIGDVGLIAELLALPATSRYSLPSSTPQRRRESTFEALLRQLEALARQKPVLMIFEDLHWIDPSSRELLDRTIERLTTLPVLLLATFRPEFLPPWTGLPQVMALTLARLDRRTGTAIVQSIAASAALSPDAAAEIVERADGTPLFLEELTRAMLEAGGRGEGVQRTSGGAQSPAAAVPAALHAPLMARLDRLGRAPKEIAQIAAAIGREFSYQLLAPVAERSDRELLDALGRLGDAGLIFCRGSPPSATYLFKHALVKDAAYGSLLRGHREELHTRIAAVLQADFGERVVVEPELLARHLTEAGLFKKAVPYWQRAGERAAERSANIEAIAHLKRGLEVVCRLPESRERDEQELLLQAAFLGPFSAKGYATAELERAAGRAVALGGQIEADSPAQVQAAWARSWLAAVHVHRGDLCTGLAIAEEASDLAERLGDPHVLSRFCLVMGIGRLYMGDLAVARRHFEGGLAHYVPDRDRAKAARYGYDFCMACHSWLGFVLWYQGHSDQALRHAENAIAAARAASHPLSETWALSFAAFVHHFRGEIAPCLRRADSARTLATEQMLPHFAVQAMLPFGWALVKAGQAEEGLARLRSAIDAYRANASSAPPWRLSLLADACLETGRIEEGLSAVREALVEAEATAVRYYEPEMYRLKGELLLAAREPDKERAETLFRKAITTACTQQSKSFELRAATSLARLLAREGKREEARAHLAPICGWFTEGFDTRDLRSAKALLDELAAS